MGAEELARYFPDRSVALFVATWNMQGQKVSGWDAAGAPACPPRALSHARSPCQCLHPHPRFRDWQWFQGPAHGGGRGGRPSGPPLAASPSPR